MKEVIINQTILNKDNIEKYKVHNHNFIKLLTPRSFITINKGEKLEEKILIENNHYKIDNYYKLFSIFVNENKYKSSIISHIPYDHIVLNVQKNIYKLNKYSNISFIEEIINKKYKKYYFETNENVEDIMIKEEIVTFLSLLKKYKYIYNHV